MVEALGELGVRAELKWPNDVLLDGRKLAGILAEASSTASALEWVVVGIGVNLGPGGSPRGPAGFGGGDSCGWNGNGRRRVALAAAVLRRLAVWYDALEKREASVLAAWRARSVGWWGQPVEVSAGERMLRGLARGVDEHGALLLELEDGATVSVLAGEARALRLLAGQGGRE